MAAPQIPVAALLALLPLVAWRMYARMRRMIGRQRLTRLRPWLTLLMFPLLLALLAVAARAHPERLWFLGIGVALGGAVGVFGLKMTGFERTPQGLFYTPNAYLGIGLSLLLIGRVIYRLVEVFVLGVVPAPAEPNEFAITPLTLGVVGLLAGYYIVYAAGLVRGRLTLLRGPIGKPGGKA
ncbi:MAG: hypothetical protein JWP43_2373 [Ramlibacter sp.]|jgi:hypothetical protein|nr:hypothetical protein [Ramlibacter sp.]